MSIGDIIKSIIEFLVIIFTVWSVFHEERYILFEDKILAFLRRRRLKLIHTGKVDCVTAKR